MNVAYSVNFREAGGTRCKKEKDENINRKKEGPVHFPTLEWTLTM